MTTFIFSVFVFIFSRLGNCCCSGADGSLTECVKDLVHTPYTGTVALTNHGLKCLAWNALPPQKNMKPNDVNFPADGSVQGAKNYCRNFEGSGRPWCYVIHEYIISGFCDLRICNGIGAESVKTLNSSPGTIMSPDEDSNGLYDYNVDLLWIIEAPERYIIQYQLQGALITNSINCHRDGLKIIEADHFSDMTLLCGEHLFDTKYYRGESYSNVLYVEFYSDYELSLYGFELSFNFSEAQSKTCERTFKQPSGWIASPDYDFDSLYDFNMHCSWTVEVDSNAVIRFQVLNVEIQFIHGCKGADYLEISDEYAPITLLCGFGGERPPIETRSNVMYVQFVSNNYLTAAGFNLTYEAVRKSVEVCAEKIHEPSGVIVSPDSNGDGFYDNNVNCHWTITVDDDHVIRYAFIYFEVEYSDNCDKDVVRLYEPSVARSKIDFCGRLRIIDKYEGETMANVLAIEFLTDTTDAYTGFEIAFVEKPAHIYNHCGGTLKNSSGYISPPDLDTDGYYDFNLYCFWHIQVNTNASIIYQFMYIAIEDMASGCNTDYLHIKEEVSVWTCATCPVSSWIIDLFLRFDYAYSIRYCGFHNITPLARTLTNQLEMKFVSDSRLSSRGFEMRYGAIENIRCGEIITGDTGWIDPPYDYPVDKHLSCEWTIFAKPDKAIQFEFIYIMIEDSPPCYWYYLETIFTFDSNNIVYMDRACGQIGRDGPYQVRNRVFFHFFANPGGNDQFLIHYEYVDDFKEDFYVYILKTNDTGYMTPLYQDHIGLYDYNLLMNWKIVVDINQIILLNILYMDIEPNDLICHKDFLKVTLMKTYRHVICGVGLKVVLISDGNVVIVKFSSDYSVNRAGFNITFVPIDGGNTHCGAVLSGSSGIITSPDKSKSGTYDNFVDCLWTIQLQDDYVIVFDITEIDIYQIDSSTCKADYLEVKEDHKTNGRFCGSVTPAPFTSEANTLYIQFITDIVRSGRGFEATYSQAKDTNSCSKDYHCLLSRKIISLSNLCDNFSDCQNSDDERYCYFRCPANCVCFGLAVDCSGRDGCHTNNSVTLNSTNSVSVPPSTRRLDVSTNPNAFSLMNLGKQNLSLLVHLNLSYCNIAEIPKDFFVTMVNLKVLDISYNKLRRLISNLFVSQTVLERLYLVGNFEPIILESESFSGLDSIWHLQLSGLHIRKISQSTFATLNLIELKIYNCQIDAIDEFSFGGLSVERMYMNSSVIKAFSETMFQGVKDLKLLKTNKYKFCCVRPNTLPEESCLPGKDEFSSCDDLIRNEILRPLVWLIGLFAILTNVSSIMFRIIKQRAQLKRSYGLFVTNLAMSDCLIGIYLLILATADSYFRNIYILHDEFWRYSGWCKLAGILSTISNEASMLFVCLITLDRLLVIKYPLGQYHFILCHAFMLSILVWTTAIVIALLPVALFSFFEDSFYSQSGVCLPLPITRARPRGYTYSVGVFIGFNSVAYTLIAIGQWSIYREIKLSSKSVTKNQSQTSTDTKVARSLLMVAVTDLLCWLPVAILGILALSNQVIDSEVFSWVAVVVLPVNAAANPAIYTLSAAWQKKKTKKTSGKDIGMDTVTFEYTGQWMEFWTNHIFWQRPGQFVDYITLTEALNTDCMGVKQRLMVARKIVRIFHGLHAQNLIQSDFQADDIFVTEANWDDVKVSMVLRLKHTLLSEDLLHNVSVLGYVLNKLVTAKKR